MHHSLATAATAVGRNKTTILRAIKNGTLSASKNELGQYQIDPAELHRVYAPVVAAQPEASADTPALHAQIEALKEIVRRVDGENADLRRQRDSWQAQAERLAIGSQVAAAPVQETAHRGIFGLFRRAG
uniref:Helix-turn-helix domain-containing protein n=1 Tax=uncultured prokaryote TaxID=198431 RepID=A0A0H5Q214_9ZZZZ|nr:hypothetical protein [uncultured prokaryote]